MSCGEKGRREGHKGMKEGGEVGLPASACIMRSTGPENVQEPNTPIYSRLTPVQRRPFGAPLTHVASGAACCFIYSYIFSHI